MDPNVATSKIIIMSSSDEIHADIDIADNLSLEDLGSLLAYIKLAEKEIIERLEDNDSDETNLQGL